MDVLQMIHGLVADRVYKAFIDYRKDHTDGKGN